MNQLATIRTAIVQTLGTVPAIGRVHDRERYLADETALRALFLHELPDHALQLRGWWLRRAQTSEHALNAVRGVAIDTWTLRGYLAFDDAAGSELAFDALIEAIRDAVRADPTLGGACALSPLKDEDEDTEDTDGVQVAEVGLVDFCGLKCHGATLRLRTWRYL
ncbi:hypothetical protein SAMN05443579_10414 [Variovorax sp. PDC80]|jgi:hypothetical protein|uniref:hypothetical protein n=1 Tax=Variovorax sp. PDC80 TaxID=1882827 RepID=UPI0008E3B6A9|nr:hypothetical protein [Variovorax sp. PDC80]SFO58827.1 hypothetical protein SAMN05443579_10414 [Variovorax sp. PDC80]